MGVGIQELSKWFTYTVELVCSEEASWSTLPNQRVSTNTRRKSVSFAEVETTFCVPDRHNLERESCWWTNDDINAFRAEAFREVREFMTRNGIYDGKHALQLMYQPESTKIPVSTSCALDILFFC